MYHDNHPNKDYEMANRVEVFDPPRAIAWLPGQPRPTVTRADDAHSSTADGSGATTSSRSATTAPKSR